MIGETILHYKILEKLGEGGMGEVYKAKDTKLDRFVALKFLPSEMTASKEEKSRFIQEAKAASSMNHPNVCTIHDIQENDGQLFIVMEFIDGVTLRDNKQPLSEKRILEIAAQVADGLGAAHEKGIIHRDIKPENIIIRKDGIVQIMDFGLAKLKETSSVSRLTKAGTTMGTMGYMSPEQVQGLDVDYRTDIFSLGVVMYELFTGETPFKGMHETAIMYEIVNVDPPPISTIKEGINPELDQIILECLEKDKDERFQSARELARNLRKLKRGSTGNRTSRIYSVSGINRTGVQQNTATNLSGPLVYEDVPLKKLLRNIVYNRKILWTGLSICFIAAVLFLYLFLTNKSSGILSGINSFTAFIAPPIHNSFATGEGGNIEVSPDGKMLAFVAKDTTGKDYLWVRQLNALEAQKLNGTEGAFNPFWSYDGKYIAYFADGKLKKIMASGGPSITICKAENGRGGSWNQNNVIIFAPSYDRGIFKVSGAGGEPVQVTKLDTISGASTNRWPYFLPDGDHFLFYGITAGVFSSEKNGIYLGSLDGKGIRRLFKAHSDAVFADNKILYVQDQTLMARPFDADNLKLTGNPVPLEENVMISPGYVRGVFSVSRDGVLIYQRGSASKSQLAWYNQSGKQEKVFGKPGDLIYAALSPDGTKIALVLRNDNSNAVNIWLYNIKRNIYTRFTFSSATDNDPCWSPDGKWILFDSNRNDKKTTALYIKSSDGMEHANQISFPKNTMIFPFSWTSDNKYVGFTQINLHTKADAYILKVNIIPDTVINKPVALFKSPFNEFGPFFSPDNKWVAYVTNETGQYQLYVNPFPDITKGKWQLSTIQLNNMAFWSPDGSGLYYNTVNNKIMFVKLNPHGTELKIGKTTTLFNIPFSGRAQLAGVTKDNKHFLFIVPVQNNVTLPLTIVTNWDKDLIQEDQE